MCWGHIKFGKTSSQLLGVDIYFRLRILVSPKHGWLWDTTTIRTHQPTKMESLLTTQFHCSTHSPHSLALGHVIGLHSSLTQVADSRFPKLRASLESSLRTCVGHLGTLVVIRSIFIYISYICWNGINLQHYYYCQTNQGTNNM